jgi:hypothetical protein
MITVSISSTDEKLVIRLKHKIDYVIEKNFGSSKSVNQRTLFVFGQLFLSFAALIYKELFKVIIANKS